MAKKRIYELAKEYNVSSKAMLNIIKELGFTVKSHSSTADEQILLAVKKKFASEKEEVKKEIEKKKEKAKARKIIEEDELSRKKAIERKMQAELRKVRKKDIKKFDTRLTAKKKKDRRRKKKERVVDLKAVKATFKKTMSSLDVAKKKKYRRSDTRLGEEVGVEEDGKVLKVTEYMTLSELADLMGVKPAVLVAKCMELGTMATINQRLDLDTIGTLALEFGFTVEESKLVGEEEDEVEVEAELETRSPVVTIMGHVDHGKTSLLDFIRESNIIAGESGGITQHIGAYEVKLPNGNITFLDTPGHQAFSSMRARGAHVTDIVVLVIAADDAVMPQTVEAIDHARAAGVPIIVAINKIDLPAANPERIKEQLTKHNLLAEDWGGKTVMVEISAKKGQNVDKLLEMILLQTEMMDLKAARNTKARGTIVESRLDRGKGPVCTVLIQKGTLMVGDSFVTGTHFGRIRAMLNERGTAVEEAPPSTPVLILGSNGVPQAGDSFGVVDGESEARIIAQKRLRLKREKDFRYLKRMTLTEVYDRIKEGQIRDLNLIIKGDVDGSVEALSDALGAIQHPEVQINIIRRSVGDISESDVLLAAASQAVIIGFHVRAESKAAELAVKEKVDIRFYKIIYEAESDIKAALEGLLAPEIIKIEIGEAEVRQVFKVPKIGFIAGSFVKNGTVKRGALVESYRNEELLGKGKISSLKRFKDDVREVASGYECGIGIEPFPDLIEGDMIRVYQEIEEARKLE
ncbi:MAG: translation initiation factor IF-2 [Candidatus Zixiibacteriota bacterium]|nr:MAG: translation initiation factor IF-2 [candidate division Zixibacteria bacterium]